MSARTRRGRAAGPSRSNGRAGRTGDVDDTGRRLALATLLTGLSRRFLETSSDEIDGVIDAALEGVGRVAEVDRAYLFVFDGDETHMTNTHEWCAPGIEPQIDGYQNRETAPFGWWMEALHRREVVYIADRDDLRDVDPAEYHSLVEQGIRSLITIPMKEESRLAGFVGFDVCERATEWSPDALALLRHLTDLLASALRRRDTEEALRRSEARSRATLAALPDFMFRVAADGTFLEVHAQDPGLLYVPVDQIVGQQVTALLPPEVAGPLREGMSRALELGGIQVVEYELPAATEPRWWEARFVRGAEDEVVCIVRDITERHGHEQRLAHDATHDPLTGLANRRRLHEELDRALARSRRAGRPLGLLFVDLDRFKVVNDTLGHAAGDELLVEAADRLRQVIREIDVPARFGGDEFAVVCGDLVQAEDALEVAERVREALHRPFDIRGREFVVGASVGVAVTDGDVDAGTLLRRADAASYRAKDEGRDRCVVWQP